MSSTRSPRRIAAALTEYWSRRVIAELDQSYVKVAKIRGMFGSHQHADEDELFLILEGTLRIEMETESGVHHRYSGHLRIPIEALT